MGLGYVGLPVAAAFARAGYPVVGFDVDQTRILELKAGRDRTREVEIADLKLPLLSFTSEAGDLPASDFFFVTGPNPIGAGGKPELGALVEASRVLRSTLNKG